MYWSYGTDNNTHTHILPIDCPEREENYSLMLSVTKPFFFFPSFVLFLREMHPVIISSIMFEEYLNCDGHFYSFWHCWESVRFYTQASSIFVAWGTESVQIVRHYCERPTECIGMTKTTLSHSVYTGNSSECNPAFYLLVAAVRTWSSW